MAKDKKDRPGENVPEELREFAICFAAEGLPELDARLIAELHDVVSSFGRDIGTDSRRILSLPVTDGKVMHVTVVMRSGSRGKDVFVSTNPRFVAADREKICAFGPPAASSLLVLESVFSTEDLRDFVAAADKAFEGLRNPLTGRRMRIMSETTESPKMDARALLANFPAGMPFPAGVTPDMAAELFERPEDVAFMNDPRSPSGFRAVLKESVVSIDVAMGVMHALLAEFGLASVRDVEAMPPDDRQRFDAEFKRRLDGIVDGQSGKTADDTSN